VAGASLDRWSELETPADRGRHHGSWGGQVPTIAERVKALLDELASDEAEQRVVEYVIREVNNGRRLRDVLLDPYVRNRLSEERVQHIIENPEVVVALEDQIAESFRKRDFGFPD
jgi:hypothetical protein